MKNRRFSAAPPLLLASCTFLSACAQAQNSIAPTAAAPPKSMAAPSDTRISDRELFEGLDESRPELAAMQNTARKGDIAGAKRALAGYFRARTDVPWRVSTLVADRKAIKWDEKAAQDAANGNLEGGLVKIKHQFPSGDIDWRFNVTDHLPGVPHNSEWQWQLNRMAHWGRLRDAYAATGDDKYAQAWVKQLRSWSEQSPPPRRAEHGDGSPWRPIEAGIRMFTSWPDAFYRFLPSPAFSPA